MKNLRFLLAALLLAAAVPSLAQEDVSGTWSGMLPVAPGTELEIHFVLERTPDGGYSAVLTSPNPDGIQNVPATSASFEDNRLVVAVDPLAGRYEGVFENGGFTGSWQQQGTELALNLVPYVESELSDAAKAALRGSWVGDLDIAEANLTLAIVLRFEDNGAGEFVGFLDSPDQGANGIPITRISLEQGELELTIPQVVGEYTATLDGDGMDGTFTQLGQGRPLAMTRGEYAPRGVEVAQEIIDQIEGSWVGQVSNAAGGSVTLVFRFETNADGALLAYLDSPDQGATGIPMTELTLDDGRLSLVVPSAQASFTATVTDAEMTGNWAQGNMSQPVTMTRGEYAPAVAALDLSDAAMQRLAGVWRGQAGPGTLVIRFETTADGAQVAFLVPPGGGGNGVPVPEAELDGDALTVRIPAMGVTVTGTLAGDRIDGQLQGGGQTNPLTLTREP